MKRMKEDLVWKKSKLENPLMKTTTNNSSDEKTMRVSGERRAERKILNRRQDSREEGKWRSNPAAQQIGGGLVQSG